MEMLIKNTRENLKTLVLDNNYGIKPILDGLRYKIFN
jgi:hypothetical protein